MKLVFPIIGKQKMQGSQNSLKYNIFRVTLWDVFILAFNPCRVALMCWASCKVLRVWSREKTWDPAWSWSFCSSKGDIPDKVNQWTRNHIRWSPEGGVKAGSGEIVCSLAEAGKIYYFSLWREDPRGWSPVSTGVVASDVREKRGSPAEVLEPILNLIKWNRKLIYSS